LRDVPVSWRLKNDSRKPTFFPLTRVLAWGKRLPYSQDASAFESRARHGGAAE